MNWCRAGDVPPGYELLQRKTRPRSGGERLEQVIVKKKGEPGLTGSIIKQRRWSCAATWASRKSIFTLNAEGAARFGEITRENVGRQLAIVLDGELYSAPVINGPIETGSGQITGDVSDSRRRSNWPTCWRIRCARRCTSSSPRDVDPTLGKDSIRSGIQAAIYGVLAVAAFMLVYYLLAGMVANVALMLNIIILLGVMCSIGTTLTLPGIAGIVLTVGMAVDANVLIYERIREELAEGQIPARRASPPVTTRAFGTIFDSHVTTLISSVILIFMGTGSVKGFGVTLTIGVAASLFTALVVTRLIFDFLLGTRPAQVAADAPPHPRHEDRFHALAKPAFIASWLLILIGIGYGILSRQGRVRRGFRRAATQHDLHVRPKQNRRRGRDPQVRRQDRRRATRLIPYQKDLVTGTRHLARHRARHGRKGGDAASQKVISQIQGDFPAAKFTAVRRTTSARPSARKFRRRRSSPRCSRCSASWFTSRSATNSRSPSARWWPSSTTC